MAKKKGKSTSGWGIPILVVLAFLAVVVWGGYGFYATHHITSQTRNYTFTRILSEDLGAALDPAKVKADNDPSVTLADVFTQRTRGEYGADTKPPDGVGLNVFFFEKDDPTSPARSFAEDNISIRGWHKKYDFGESAPTRRTIVEQAETKFNASSAHFCAKRTIVRNLGIIVDTTNGPSVNETLAEKVKLALDEKQLAQLINAGQTVNISVQLLSEYTYPDRAKAYEKATATDLKKLLAWVRNAPETKESSIYAGLNARMEELKKQGITEFLVFTDGIENKAGKDGISLYGHPEFFAAKKVDLANYFAKHFTLDVTGMVIDLHPIPPRPRPDLRRIDEATQPPALEALSEFLTARKARVTLSHSS